MKYNYSEPGHKGRAKNSEIPIVWFAYADGCVCALRGPIVYRQRA